jgi:CheY-like chemotaxis protein/HPt (histidine-containing phosphotransfer) domain-containing protein
MMVTAYGREEVIKSAEAAGIQDVLIKPVNPSILFDTVMRSFGMLDEERGTLEGSGNTTDLAAIAGTRVLLVEDNDMNQQVASELLADAGFVVDIAADGKIALDMVQAKPADYYGIVLMDMQMPVMDGVTATIEIRKQPQFADLPIVAMTANAMQQDRERCTAAGMNDHVAKPIDPDELWQALLKWVKPRTAPAEAATQQVGAGVTAVLAPPTAATGADGLPQGIPGLDVALGLKRVVGKQSLYLSMLRKFVAGQKSAPDQITAALDAEDWGTAERVAHTLKGTAGNIGATELQTEAGKLEAALRDKQARATVDDLLSVPAQLLAELIAALETALPPVPGSAPVTAAELEQLKPLATQLHNLVANDDPEATTVWSEHAALFKAAFPDHWQKIETCLRSFDFEEALELVRAAARARGLENT